MSPCRCAAPEKIGKKATFNDGQACVGAIDHVLQGITGMLNHAQARELAAELAAANLHLTNRPKFQTLMSNPDGADLRIVAHVPDGGPMFDDKDPGIVGFVKYFLLSHTIGNVPGQTREETAELLRQNRISFMFNNEGDFIDSGYQPDRRPSVGTWSPRSVALE